MPKNFALSFSGIIIIIYLFNRPNRKTARRAIGLFEIPIKKIINFARLNPFKPSGKIFLLTVSRRCFFVDHLCYFCLVLLCFHARLFVDAL